MSRPPATSRKLRRVLVLLALFLVCERASQTARALLGAGAVPFSRSVPPGTWARNFLVARRAKADGPLDRGEAEGNEDDKAPKGKDDVEEAKASFDQGSRNKAVDEAASAQTADPVEDAKQDLDAAKRQRDVALRGLETAQSGLETAQDLTAYLQKQLLELEDSSSEKADEIETKKKELKVAKEELTEAKKELKVAKEELTEAEQKYEAKASIQAGRVQALPAGSSAAFWVKDALKSKFDDDMQNGNICMLQNWDTYKSTLPVREVDNKALPLFELLYFGKEADVQTLGSLLANVPGTTGRLVAPYLTAPGAYGKTSSVLPAFLTNDDFGLYLYMSFYNNAEQRHAGPSLPMIEKMHRKMTDPETAGVAFMWDCLKTQLENGRYVRNYPLPEWFTSIADGTAVDIDKLRARIKNSLDEIRPGQKLVLIHLDEHKKMWEGEYTRAIQFRRAAVQALLSIDFVRVILTFTEPPSLPPDDARNTSALARVALPFARAAADKVVLHFCPDILGMYGKPADWKASEQRVWACCLLWVSLCIDAESPTALHRQDSQLRQRFSSLTTWLQKGAKKQTSQFLAKFGETFQDVITWDKGQDPLDTEMVRKLVAGIKDADAPQKEVMPTLVSVSGQHLCLPLFRLLYIQPLNPTELSSCFWESRDVFIRDMRNAPAKVLVGSPLERAVLCALTCRDSLRLPNGSSIMLSFQQLEAGRLFKKVSATGSELQLDTALESLTRHTLYYDGLDGTEGHPLADIWFCAAPKRLVLLDCGGTKKKKASKKMSAKKRQISQLVDNGCFSGWKVTVLLFIPAAPSETKTSSTSLSDDVDIAIVAGSLATEWLGSWSQLWQYFPDDG